LHTNRADISDIEMLRPVSLSDDLARRLRHALTAAVRRVLTAPLLRGDLHFAYFYRLDGVGGPPDADDRYRQEHFVVPTVPILLSLVSRLDDRLLFRRQVSELISSVTQALLAKPTPRVVPQQPSGANGTVNMVYLHDALAEIHDELRHTASLSRSKRAALLLRERRPPATILNNGWTTMTVGVALGGALSRLLS
jgi:hypothetical protein